MLDTEQMRTRLRKAVNADGGQKAWALKNGVSPQYVSDCINGRRDIGEKISRALGYVPVTVYQRVGDKA